MVCLHTDSKHVALYDSVSGQAFGPLFDSENDAQEFIEWNEEQAHTHRIIDNGAVNESAFKRDPREYTQDDLADAIDTWNEERDREVSSGD